MPVLNSRFMTADPALDVAVAQIWRIIYAISPRTRMNPV